MRTPLDALVTEKALHLVHGGNGGDLADWVLDRGEAYVVSGDEIPRAPVVKNVCAKVTVQLSDEIDDVCNLLDISKRRFLEAAMLEAVQKAKAIMDAEGVWEALDGQNGWRKVEAEA